MNQIRRALLLSAALLLLTFSTSFAQAYDPSQKIEPSYEVSLQVLIGSNDVAGRSDLPSNLNAISRHLRENFSYSNYRLADTFLGRITNTGNIDYRSVSNVLGQGTDVETQTFLEWSMSSFRSQQNGFQARSFRFGARVPIRTGSVKDEAGRTTPVLTYESVGLNMSTIGLPANTPTLVGTISLPRTTGTIFLVATIRSTD
jgi:hypothetical protein